MNKKEKRELKMYLIATLFALFGLICLIVGIVADPIGWQSLAMLFYGMSGGAIAATIIIDVSEH